MVRAVWMAVVLVGISAALHWRRKRIRFTASPPPARGRQREWEKKFKAIPSPQIMRDTMQRLSARPHHVGSPYDKDNAEWILARFKSWGLDAHIEQYDVLFPTPKTRVVELDRADPLCRKAPGAGGRGRSDFGSAVRATSFLQRLLN